jgi:hypothetical protein
VKQKTGEKKHEKCGKKARWTNHGTIDQFPQLAHLAAE